MLGGKGWRSVMMWTPALTKLRVALQDTFAMADTIGMIVDEAGIPRAYINFQAAPAQVWHTALREAQRLDRVEALIATARQHYPTTARLSEASEEYLRSKAAAPALIGADNRWLEVSSATDSVFMHVSVLNEDASSWGRGEDTILQYSADERGHLIRIGSNLGYRTAFDTGEPIRPLAHMTPSHCSFWWDFPILDFKVLNNRPETLYLTELVFDVEESRLDQAPFFTIRRDQQQRCAGSLLMVNEGGCDIVDLTISFHLLPGEIEAPRDPGPPYPHSVVLPLLAERAEVDVTQSFQDEGVDIAGLILLTNGERESENEWLVPTADGQTEQLTIVELEEREKQFLGKFQEWVGTLVGDIQFSGSGGSADQRRVRFYSHVYLANRNRFGVPRPPSYPYDVAFPVQGSNYQRRVPIAHELKQGETDRFTLKLAVAQSSCHRFRATIRDISGLTLATAPIEMKCFVPRCRRESVNNAISPPDHDRKRIG
jgi:hypothetical protein